MIKLQERRELQRGGPPRNVLSPGRRGQPAELVKEGGADENGDAEEEVDRRQHDPLGGSRLP